MLHNQKQHEKLAEICEMMQTARNRAEIARMTARVELNNNYTSPTYYRQQMAEQKKYTAIATRLNLYYNNQLAKLFPLK